MVRSGRVGQNLSLTILFSLSSSQLARVCYVYWMSKFVEYFDTVSVQWVVMILCLELI